MRGGRWVWGAEQLWRSVARRGPRVPTASTRTLLTVLFEFPPRRLRPSARLPRRSHLSSPACIVLLSIPTAGRLSTFQGCARKGSSRGSPLRVRRLREGERARDRTRAWCASLRFNCLEHVGVLTRTFL